MNDIQFTIIFNCVDSDLLSIKQGDYTDIITKLKSLPPRDLESVLELLNLHVVGNLNRKKNVRSHHEACNFQLIPKKSV